MSAGLAPGPDGRPRCWWAVGTPAYVAYHDEEWGRPVRGDDALFERISLEAFQSGLSWLTILRKRENFRAAFAGFRIERAGQGAEGPGAAVRGPDDRLRGDAGVRARRRSSGGLRRPWRILARRRMTPPRALHLPG